MASLELTQPSILAAHDLAPSDVRELDPAKVMGLCLESGGAGAHSVILARAIGIPAVVGLGPALSALPEGITVALDGEQGVVWVSPEPDQIRLIESRRENGSPPGARRSRKATGRPRRAMAAAFAFWPTSAVSRRPRKPWSAARKA